MKRHLGQWLNDAGQDLPFPQHDADFTNAFDVIMDAFQFTHNFDDGRNETHVTGHRLLASDQRKAAQPDLDALFIDQCIGGNELLR